jgi:hypothetical protein
MSFSVTFQCNASGDAKIEYQTEESNDKREIERIVLEDMINQHMKSNKLTLKCIFIKSDTGIGKEIIDKYKNISQHIYLDNMMKTNRNKVIVHKKNGKEGWLFRIDSINMQNDTDKINEYLAVTRAQEYNSMEGSVKYIYYIGKQGNKWKVVRRIIGPVS